MIITLPDCKIHVLDSPKQLTAERHKDFEAYHSQDNDIGSDSGSLKKRASEILNFMDSDPDTAKRAAINLLFTVQSIENKISYNSRAFALLVQKWEHEGKEIFPGYSDEELDETIKTLSGFGLTQEKLEESLREVKKKSIEN